MVMSSHQIAGMAAQQQAMFGNFQSYAQQITPPYGQGPGMGALRPPLMGGYQVGPPPMMPPPPPPMPGWGMGYGGGMADMAMALPFASPNMRMPQVMGEQMGLSALGGLSTVGSGLARVAGYGTMAAGGLSMLGVGGVGMAAAAGLPGMLAVGGIEAGAWGAQQLYTGAQQQQQMNRVLRSRFGGMTGVGGGRMGMGFSNQEMGDIGSMVRSMANEDMFTSVEELTRLMDKTASMGLYRGVQSAKQFQTRFRELTTTLREVAQTLSTSLEGATQFMDQARQQGFFSGQDISRTLTQTRMAAGASGMSMDQLMAIRGQGTQMGRMMGMRGRQGATAMMNMATNLGVGMQTGAISDELIAEATGGLTGAEGAQAAAGMLMQSNARWMRRGAGRVMLAGLWDPASGGINMERLQQAMGGGMSFQGIRSMGRANIRASGGRGSEFFANEERIAGMLQETGLAGAVQFGMLEQHIGRRRGIGADDPLGERFIRRHTGWSQSEFELNREMYRNMPQILEERRMREAQQMQIGVRSRAMEGRGVEGMRRRISHWWESEVENPIRQAGADLMTSFSQAMEQAVDTMEGTVKTHVSERTKSLLAQYAESGKRGNELMSFREFQKMRQDLRPRMRIDEGGVLGAVGRWAGMRPETIAARIEGINAYGGGLGRGATAEEKIAYLNRFSDEVNKRAGDFGIGGAQLSQLGEKAYGAFMGKVGTGEQYQLFRNRARAFGSMSGEAKEAFMEERISMYTKADKGLAGAFGKAKTYAERMALLREIEGASGLGREARMPVEDMLQGRTYEGLQAELKAAKEQEGETISGIADMLVGKQFYRTELLNKEEMSSSPLINILRGKRRIEGRVRVSDKEMNELREKARKGDFHAGEVLAAIERTTSDMRREFGGTLASTMSNEFARGLMIEAANGDPNAMKDLVKLVQDPEFAASKGVKNAEAVGRIVDQMRKEGDKGPMAEAIRKLGKGSALKELIALSENVAESGRKLTTSLRSNEAIIDAAKGVQGGQAYDRLKEIAEAQSTGDWDRVNELRGRFFSDFVGKEGTERLAGALAADPTGAATSLGVGMQRTARLIQKMSGRRGSTEALHEALREVGLSTKDLGGEAFREVGGLRGLLKKMTSEGGMSSAELMKMFKDQGAIGEIGERRFGQELTPWLQRMKGGLSEKEIRELAVGEGAEAAERGATRGPESRQTLADKQVNLLTQMVKLTELGLKRADMNADQLSAAIEKIQKDSPVESASGGSSTSGGGE